MIDVALLGTGGMMPMPERFLSSMLLRINGRLILVDCGEGTQVTLKMLGWGFKAIDTICFTHYHADHISGLPGMLLTIGNSGRTEPVKLIGPPGLKKVVGRRLAARVLKTWVEDFVDEDTGEVVSIERNEIIVDRETVLENEHIDAIVDSGAKTILLHKEKQNLTLIIFLSIFLYFCTNLYIIFYTSRKEF